jgi:hypothetical protein
MLSLAAVSLLGGYSFGAPSGSGQAKFTVAWPPTNAPVLAPLGKTLRSQFWVANDESAPLSFRVVAETATPRNDGSITTRLGIDERFPRSKASPTAFTVPPHQETEIHVTVPIPLLAQPGVYLLAYQVSPRTAKGGAVGIESDITALITFAIPGATGGTVDARLRIAIGQSPMAGPGGSADLHVTDESGASTTSYHEIDASIRPFGTVTLLGHTTGEAYDLRSDAALYFPGTTRQYPFHFQVSFPGIGIVTLRAYVYYHPNPNTVVATTATATEFVVSWWWSVVVAGYICLFVIGRARLRSRRARTGHLGKRRRIPTLSTIGSLVPIAIFVLVVTHAETLALAAVGGVGVISAVALGSLARRRGLSRVLLGIDMSVGLVLAGVCLAAAVADSVVSTFPPVAFGVAAGVAVWLLAADWTTWSLGRSSSASKARIAT